MPMTFRQLENEVARLQRELDKVRTERERLLSIFIDQETGTRGPYWIVSNGTIEGWRAERDGKRYTDRAEALEAAMKELIEYHEEYERDLIEHEKEFEKEDRENPRPPDPVPLPSVGDAKPMFLVWQQPADPERPGFQPSWSLTRIAPDYYGDMVPEHHESQRDWLDCLRTAFRSADIYELPVYFSNDGGTTRGVVTREDYEEAEAKAAPTPEQEDAATRASFARHDADMILLFKHEINLGYGKQMSWMAMALNSKTDRGVQLVEHFAILEEAVDAAQEAERVSGLPIYIQRELGGATTPYRP